MTDEKITAVDALEEKEYRELEAFVRANGYMKLDTHAKRNRYRELKDKYSKDLEEVTITKKDLEEMIKESSKKLMEDFKKEYELKQKSKTAQDEVKELNKWLKLDEGKKANRTAKLRVYRENGLSEGGVIIDLKFKENVFNEDTRKYDTPIYRVSVLYKDEVKDIEMPLTKVSEISEYEVVEILKEEKEVETMIQGVGNRAVTESGYKYSNPELYGTISKGDTGKFDYEVTRENIYYLIRRPNGKELKIHSSKLNQ